MLTRSAHTHHTCAHAYPYPPLRLLREPLYSYLPTELRHVQHLDGPEGIYHTKHSKSGKDRYTRYKHR